ncbi:unnamed protein product [Effrenium voratum]|uniref:Uncharacterized protein n=1 Tax=Effrenium voratum TaxID=2562239 RepID=A0AA36I014_9DINO|nr:unnamed protein product [Effrenium voratum]CAJ1440665.1 unnamed protein product [Effrenium voratum]
MAPLEAWELRRLQNGPVDSVVVTSAGLRKVRHLKPLRRPAPEAAEREIPLRPDAGPETRLRFGDGVWLLLPPLEEASKPLALCACARPQVTEHVGPRELQPTDAVAEELRLARDLAASGRRARGLVALTGAPLEGSRRALAWALYRANGLDGFKEEAVHYGQPLQLGQPSVDGEVLLSCEPPSRGGGMGSSYSLLGRFADFGHAVLGRKGWHDVFVFAPVRSGDFGDPVDLRHPLRIVPLAPYSYLHGMRLVQAAPFGLPNRVGRGCASRAAVTAFGSELLLRAAQPEPELWDTEWFLQRLVYDGPVPASVNATGFARWSGLRSAVLERLRRRREVCAFSTLRKILSKDRLLSEPRLGMREPAADAVEEPILVGKSYVEATLRCSYGLCVSEADMQHVVDIFSATWPGADEPIIDVDAFLDALRGEISVGRLRTLEQLYSLLQKEAGGRDSLSLAWVRARIADCAAESQLFPVSEVMSALPLIRTHASVTRQIFSRWQMDLFALVDRHELLLEFLRQMWGDVVLKLGTDEEKANWTLPLPAEV